MNSSVDGNVAYHSENFGGGEGGGIFNYGTLTITNSTISGNGAGAPDPFPAGTAINSNQVWLEGGGISSGGTLTITSSTVSGNGGYRPT